MEEGAKLIKEVKVTVAFKSAVTAAVLPEMSGGGWVGVRKVVRVGVSVTETEELSSTEDVVELGKVT